MAMGAAAAKGAAGGAQEEGAASGLVVVQQMREAARREQERLRGALEAALRDAADAKGDAAKLQEQLRVLKDVVRELQEELARVEDFGAGADGAVANAEYLKNVLVGYLTSTDPSEHRRILPVIRELLHLGVAEVQAIEAAIELAEAGVIHQVGSAVTGTVSWFLGGRAAAGAPAQDRRA